MDEEVVLIRENMDNLQERDFGTVKVLSGTIGGKACALTQSGIGKVNAAIATTLLIREYRVDALVNTGSAGALDPLLEIGDVVIGERLVYHDVDVRAFGYNRGQIPRLPVMFSSHSTLVHTALSTLNSPEVQKLLQCQVVQGLIASGDQFINNPEVLKDILVDFPDCLLVEMESAAIAHTSHVMGVPFIIIRSVSDRADSTGAKDFTENLHKASVNSARAVLAVVRDLKY